MWVKMVVVLLLLLLLMVIIVWADDVCVLDDSKVVVVLEMDAECGTSLVSHGARRAGTTRRWRALHPRTLQRQQKLKV